MTHKCIFFRGEICSTLSIVGCSLISLKRVAAYSPLSAGTLGLCIKGGFTARLVLRAVATDCDLFFFLFFFFFEKLFEEERMCEWIACFVFL